MYSRALSPTMQSLYTSTFDKKPVKRQIGANLSLWNSTNATHYSETPKTLYQSDYESVATSYGYVRPPSAKMELLKLPPEYQSTVKPQLDPEEPISSYQHCFGKIGQQIVTKRNGKPVTVRHLSKQTTADINGTTRITHYPPGYSGYIPRGFKGNRGKEPREDKNVNDLLWQYSENIPGYGGFQPSIGNEPDYSNVKHTMTTYRDLCLAIERK